MRDFLKRGFTLAEALIVMTILGVVAAISIPQLGYNMQKSKNASTLAGSIRQIETGCRSIISYHNSLIDDGSVHNGYSTIKQDGAYINGKDFFDTNQEFFNISPVTDSNRNGYTPKTFDKSTNMTSGYAGSSVNLFAIAATGAWIGWGAEVNSDTDNDPIIDIIFIDVNGNNKPNNLGKDIFVFGLTDTCKMIPAGSARMRTLGYPSQDSDICTHDSQGTGMACANLVVKDGFKINY